MPLPVSNAVDRTLRRQQVDAYLNLFRIGRVMLRRSEALLAGAALGDLTPAHASVLMVLLHEKRPMTARQLAQSLEITQVTVSRFLKSMEQAGWIARHPDPTDGRARCIQPTPRARQALPQLAAISNALLDDAFAHFSAEDMARLAAAVQQIRDNLAPPTEKDHRP